jgi:transposase InsO family protein
MRAFLVRRLKSATPVESFFGTLKSESVNHRVYRARDEARTDLFFCIEAFYNRRRRHSSLDYLSPEVYEQLYQKEHSLYSTPCPRN